MTNSEKLIMIGLFLIMLALTAGCTIVEPFITAGNSAADTIGDFTDQQCKDACEKNYKILPIGCSCPEKPAVNETG